MRAQQRRAGLEQQAHPAWCTNPLLVQQLCSNSAIRASFPTCGGEPPTHLHTLHDFLAHATAPLLPILRGAAAARLRACHPRRNLGRQAQVSGQGGNGPSEPLLYILSTGRGGAKRGAKSEQISQR